MNTGEMAPNPFVNANVPPAQKTGHDLASKIVSLDPSARLSAAGIETVVREFLDRSLIQQGCNELLEWFAEQGTIPKDEIPLIREGLKYVLVSGGKGLQTRPFDEQNPKGQGARQSYTQQERDLAKSIIVKGGKKADVEAALGKAVTTSTFSNWKLDAEKTAGGSAGGGGSAAGGGSGPSSAGGPGNSGNSNT